MGHNAVGRPYFLTDMLRRRYDALLIGPLFPAFGDGIWPPIRNSDVPMRSFSGVDLPEYVELAEKAVRGLETDLVIACKPRFPGLLIAMLLKRSHGVPVIADLDEWELSWTGADEGLSLDDVEGRRGERELEQPYGQIWTRVAEELIGDADAITVASPVLQDIYGGKIVAQARDELVFDPGRYDRAAVRTEYGYIPEDRVLLFLGTPRRFKGIIELADALEELGDPRYKLCVIGSISDPGERSELERSGRVQLVEYRPVSEVPLLTLIGDLVCLLQDPEHTTTQHQLPAKLTELLAMNVPVLVRETPPLEPFIKDGLVSGIADVPVATRIAELFSDQDALRAQAERARRYFLDKLSYEATLEVLECVFSDVENGRREMPPNWRRAVDLAMDVPEHTKATADQVDVNARAIKWPRPGVVKVVDVRLRQPNANEALVDSVVTVTSTGTELARFRSLPNAVVEYPHRPGFMAAGTVAATNVPTLEVGDPVAVRHVQHQSRAVVSARNVHAIPPGVELVDGALWHVGLIALYGLRRGGHMPGRPLAVLGAGIVGATVRRLALAMGTPVCLVVTTSDAKHRDSTRDQGARFVTLNATPLDHERERYPLTIDATGTAGALVASVALTAAEGTVVLLGSPRSESSALPVRAMQDRGVRVIGAHIATLKEFASEHLEQELTDTYFRLLESGVSFTDLIEHHTPDEARQVYEVAAQQPEFIAAAFDWSRDS